MQFIDEYKDVILGDKKYEIIAVDDANERYWREYSSHKEDKDDRSLNRTKSKMKSLNEYIDCDLICKYFDARSNLNEVFDNRNDSNDGKYKNDCRQSNIDH